MDNQLSGITVSCGPHLPCAGIESLDALGREIFRRPELLELEQSLELLERNIYYPFLKLKKQATQPCILIGPDADRYAAQLGPSFFLDDQQASLPTMPAAGPLEVVTREFGASLVMSTDARNDRLGSELLAEVKQIKDLLLTNRGRTKAPRPRGRGGKGRRPTVDQRVKELHHKSPDVAEGETLKEIAKIIGCVPGAIPGGTYYETKLKPRRDRVRAAKGLERSRAENRQAIRDNRDHIESYEDVDDHIDATWDERQGGRFSG